MPRKRRGFEEPPRRTVGKLVERLVDELRSDRQSGQPMIEEEEFPTKKLRVNVIWDEWDRVPLEDRTATILRAYEQAEGREYRDRPRQRPDGARGARGRHVAVPGHRRRPQGRPGDEGPVPPGADRRRRIGLVRLKPVAQMRNRNARGGGERAALRPPQT